MPYDPDTGVAEGLLHILDRTVGRKTAGELLHDHLDKPDDRPTYFALVRAARAEVAVEHDVNGEDMSTRMTFRTRIGDRGWNGDAIDIPAIPMALAIGVAGRPLDTVIGHPMLPPAPIAGTEGNSDRRLLVQRRDVPMRELRPGPIGRAMSGLRRERRRSELVRRLHAHVGYSQWVVYYAILLGLFVAMMVGLVVATSRPERYSDHVADLSGAGVGIAVGALLAWTLSRMTGKHAVVRQYVEEASANIAARGHPGSDHFSDPS